MSEQSDMTPLTGLATQRGAAFRDDPADNSVKAGKNKQPRRNGFDGFLKTFLGGDAKSGAARTAEKSGGSTSGAVVRSRQGGSSKSASASGLSAREKNGLKQALEKTVPGNEDEQPPVDADPAVAAAAEEAAMLIWNILNGMYSLSELPELSGEMASSDPIAALAELLEGMDGNKRLESLLSGVGADGVDAEAVRKALATANASAEMNIDAVLVALEELLDGMPRDALEKALADTAATAAAKDDPFAALAEALGAEVIAVEEEAADVVPDKMLSELGKGLSAPVIVTDVEGLDVASVKKALEADVAAAPAAESAGLDEREQELQDLLKQFLEEKVAEKSAERPIKADDSQTSISLEKLMESFQSWLRENDNSGQFKDLTSDTQALAKILATVLEGDEATFISLLDGLGQSFSFVKGELEKFLQSSVGKAFPSEAGVSADKATVELGAGGQPAKTKTVGDEAARELFSNILGETGGQAGQSAVAASRTASSAPSASSSMLEQIQNIERLTEAMRMANRGGVKNLTLQLSPPELGKVLLRVESRDGVVSAFLRVEKAEAAAQLSNSLQNLRENLKAQGIELGELDIRQQGHHGQAAGDGSRHGRNHEADPDGSGSGKYSGLPDEDEADLDASPGGSEAQAGGGGLNLFA